MNTPRTPKLFVPPVSAMANAFQRAEGSSEPAAAQQEQTVPAAEDRSEYNKGIARRELDGVTHINIAYPRAATELGYRLADFTTARFKHPYFGPFHSMESFGQYIKTGRVDDTLRTMKGAEANRRGKELPMDMPENFGDIMMEAHYFKVLQTPGLQEMLVESVLPFDHYYLYGPGQILIRPTIALWLVPGFEKMREMLRRGEVWPAVDHTQHRPSLPVK